MTVVIQQFESNLTMAASLKELTFLEEEKIEALVANACRHEREGRGNGRKKGRNKQRKRG